MERIILNNSLPDVFLDNENIQSDIWKQELVFNRKNSYLIEAASGVGKSSLCSYLYGSRTDYSGEIRFDGDNLRVVSPKSWDEIRSSHLSLLFQELRLFSELSAYENVVLKNNLTAYKTEPEIDLMFQQLGIANKKDVKIAKLSWGQRQRVAIIRSLCQPFDFIILDEPISHLDDKNAKIAAVLIAEEVEKQNAGLLVTSIGRRLPIDYSYTLSL